MKQHATTKGSNSPIYQIMGDQNIHVHLEGASLRVRGKENLGQVLDLLQDSIAMESEQNSSLLAPNQGPMDERDTAVNDFLLGKIAAMHSQIISLEKANSVLFEEEYQRIRQAEINNDKQSAWALLQPIVDDIDKQTNHQYARFFYLAAQLIIDQNTVLSEKYYNIGQTLDPTSDTRVYRASLLARQQQYADAEAVLTPLDTTPVLNRYLLLQFEQGKGDQFELSAECSTIPKDAQTDQAIALCCFQAEDYIHADELAEELTSKYPNSAMFWYLRGMIKYWEGIPYKSEQKPCDSLPLHMARRVHLAKEQTEAIKKALEYFLKSESCSRQSNSQYWLCESLMGVLLAKWALGLSDAIEACKSLLKVQPDNITAILFLQTHNIDIPKDNLNALRKLAYSENGTGLDAIILVRNLIDLVPPEDALQLIDDLQMKIQEHSCVQYIHLLVQVNLRQNKCKEAKKIVHASKLSPKDKRRLILFVGQFEVPISKDKQIKLAHDLARNPGEELDYYNLCNSLRSFCEWSELAKAANEWYEKHESTEALMLRADALYKSESIDKCLNALEKVEAVGALDLYLIKLKISCFAQKARYDEAMSLILGTGLSASDEELVILQSQILFSQGDKLGAIAILKAFADSNPDRINPVMRLAELLLAEHKHESYRYISRLAEFHPDNIEVNMKCMQLGFDTGHDKEASTRLMKMAYNDSNKEYAKAVTSSEVMQIFAQRREENSELDKQLLAGELPIHVVFDKLQSELSWYTFGIWVKRMPHPLYWCSGAWRYPRMQIDSVSIIMDYSACLSAHCLNLFDKLKLKFEKIYIHPNLLPAIDLEITRLSHKQDSVFSKHKRLLDYLEQDNCSVRFIAPPAIPEGLHDIQLCDLQLHYGALEIDGYFVEDQFATELFEEKEVPSEFKTRKIARSDLLRYLAREGHITLPDNAENSTINPTIQQGIKVLVREDFLEQIQELMSLSDFCELFKVHVFQSDLDYLRGYFKQICDTDECIKWLQGLKVELQSLRESGLLFFCEQYKHHYPKEFILSKMLGDELSAAIDSNIPLWADERWLQTSPPDGKFQACGIIDVLASLQQSDLITESEHYRFMQDLISRNVVYFVPDSNYILHCLKKASFGENTIQETKALREIRRVLGYSLSKNSAMGKSKSKYLSLPEAKVYLMRHRDICSDVLIGIWNSDKENEWKLAAASWWLLYLSDFICDVSFNDTVDLPDAIAAKHLLLLTKTLLIDAKSVQLFCDWILAYLCIYWRFDPDNYYLVAKCLASFLIGFDDQIQRILVRKLSDFIPTDLLGRALLDPSFGHKWDDLFEEVSAEIVGSECVESQEPQPTDKPTAKQLTGDLAAHLNNVPEDWLDVITNLILGDQDDPIKALLVFFNAYIDKYGNNALPLECINAIAMMAWHSPPKYRVDIQELRRRL